MKNYICTGERIDVIAPAGGLSSGDPFVIGSKIGIVLSGGSEGETVVCATEGVFELPKAVGAINQGQKLYFDGTAKKITTVAAGNTLAGYAFRAALSGDATAFVTLTDDPSTPQAAFVAAIATVDGSDAGTTQTLANATKVSVNSILTALKAAGLMLNA